MNGNVQRCAYCGTTLVVSTDSASAAPSGGVLRLEECGPNKIQVIKVIREYTGLGLKEAKDLSESAPCVLAENLDASRVERFRADLAAVGARAGTSAMVESPNPHAQSPASPASVTTSVFLQECGPNKIAVIKVIYQHTGLGLKESKDLCESAPCPLMENADPTRAAKFRDALVAAGARVR